VAVQLGIHVTPDSNPKNIEALIRYLYQTQQIFDSKSSLLEQLNNVGIGSRSEITALASEMGVIGAVSESQIGLTKYGWVLAQIREEALNDLLHYVLYTGWSKEQPRHFLQSWAYRQCSDQYWELEEVELTTTFSKKQVSDIANLVDEVFPLLGVQDYQEVSFSTKSINGVHKWLEALDPPVLVGKSYKRRTFCQPELMMMALAYVLRDDADIYETDVLLTPEIREQLCRITHLDPNALDETLDWALSAYPKLVAPGTTAGFYGRFVRVRRLPQLVDMIR